MVLPILIVTICLVSIKVNASEEIGKTAIEIKNSIDLLASDTTKRKKLTPPTPPNLQTKVVNYTSISNSKEDGPAIFNAPKIQKDVIPSKSNDPIFYTAEKPAEFPGGSAGWVKYLSKNLNVDLPVKNRAPAGRYTVVLNFVVKSNGEVADVEAINNPGYGTAAEAIRMIEKGPKWIPAQQNGKKVNYLVKQNLVFVVSE